MATSKPPYDPVKTVEGMFMGSVTRIAYAMKDPLNYAQSTKAVLAETAKKFQDALDDCEIQILDAKWYLENKLAMNRARRAAAAKAKEDSAATTKRKHDETLDTQDKSQAVLGGQATKRPRTEEPEPQPQAQQNAQKTSPIQKPAPQPPIPAQTTSKVSEAPIPSKPAEKPQLHTDVKPTPPAAPVAKPQEKPPEPGPKPTQPPSLTTIEDFPKATPQDTPAADNEAFNFESMFGDPSADMIDNTGNDPSFDFQSFENDTFTNDNDHSLNSILPGLESYANQAKDDNTFNLSGTTLNGLATDSNNTTQDLGLTDPSMTQNQGPLGDGVSNDFDLPALGPNEFDDFLNANDMNFDAPGVNVDLQGGAGDVLNLEGMENMNDIQDLDFDSMFNE
jgi:hypothetical protein